MEGGGGDVFILVGESSTDKSARGRGFAGLTVSYAICLALQGPWTRPVSASSIGSTVSGPSLADKSQSVLQITIGKLLHHSSPAWMTINCVMNIYFVFARQPCPINKISYLVSS